MAENLRDLQFPPNNQVVVGPFCVVEHDVVAVSEGTNR